MRPPPLPSVVGTNGVGRPADGRRVYFDATVPPFGSMAERALVPAVPAGRPAPSFGSVEHRAWVRFGGVAMA
jgi:hypothetical protein